jgi:hypothetical protein
VAGGFSSTVAVSVPAGGAVASGVAAATAVVGPSAILMYYAVPPPHPHLPADHDDLIATSVELTVVVVFLFVAFRLVRVRILGADELSD